MTIRTPISLCPSCNRVIDAATEASGSTAVPEPGDVSVCAYCGTFLEFTDDLTVKEASTDTLRSLDDKTLADLLAARKFAESLLLAKTTYH